MSPMKPQTKVHRGHELLPDPGVSGIEHVVVVMMENRSFEVLKMIEWRWVIARPPLEPCILDIFETTPAGETVVNSAKALQIAQAKHDSGEQNESYDFYLLLKSEHMQGWAVPQGLTTRRNT